MISKKLENEIKQTISKLKLKKDHIICRKSL